MSLSHKQAKLVQSTLPALRLHGERIASLFYATMLQQHPELRDIFNTANMQNGRQPRALTTIIIAFAANLSHTSDIIPQLERVCQKHCSLSIQPEQYAIVGEYLIRAFHAVLGPVMTPEVQEAWTDAYCVLARMMIGREAHLYRSFTTWPTWRRLRVAKKVAESEDIFSFYLEPVDDGESIDSARNSTISLSSASQDRSSLSSDNRRSSISSNGSSGGSGGGSGGGGGSTSRYGHFASRLRTNNVNLLKSKAHGNGSNGSNGSRSLSHSHSRHRSSLPYFFPGQYVSVRMLVPKEEADDDASFTTEYSRHGSSSNSHVRPHTYYQARQYSLSDRWRPGGCYRISVKRDAGTRFANAVASSFFHPGAVSNALIDQVDVGSLLEVSHPAGVFFLNVDPELVDGTDTVPSPLGMHPPLRPPRHMVASADPLGRKAPPLVLISAGIGAAPLVAMVRSVAETQPQRPLTYVHGSRYAPAVFSEEIRALQQRQGEKGALRTAYFYSSGAAAAAAAALPTPVSEDGMCLSFAGHVDLEKLRHAKIPNDDAVAAATTTTTTTTTATASSPDSEATAVEAVTDLLFLHNTSTEYFVCGPEPFMMDMAMHLVDELGVSRQRIMYELFSTGDLETARKDGRLREFMRV